MCGGGVVVGHRRGVSPQGCWHSGAPSVNHDDRNRPSAAAELCP